MTKRLKHNFHIWSIKGVCMYRGSDNDILCYSNSWSTCPLGNSDKCFYRLHEWQLEYYIVTLPLQCPRTQGNV